MSVPARLPASRRATREWRPRAHRAGGRWPPGSPPRSAYSRSYRSLQSWRVSTSGPPASQPTLAARRFGRRLRAVAHSCFPTPPTLRLVAEMPHRGNDRADSPRCRDGQALTGKMTASNLPGQDAPGERGDA